MIYATVASFAFLVSLGTIPLILWVSHKNRWYDSTDHRKIHSGDIPRTGGVGIFTSFLGVPSALFAVSALVPAFAFRVPAVSILPIAVGVIIMFITGLLDDFKNLRARYKLYFQIAAALVVALSGYRFFTFQTPFGFSVDSPIVSYFVTLLWIVGVTNALNLIDGIDGLAGGVSGIAALFWGVLSLIQGHMFSAVLSFAIFGAAAGFLVYNLPPARIFMGDSGSLVLGFALACLPLVEKVPGTSTRVLLLAVTLLIIPIFDTLAAILRRVREKQSIGSPDKAHMHHKLLDCGYSVPRVLFIVYKLCFVSGFAALLWSAFPAVFNLFLLPLAWIPAAVFFLVLHYRYRRNRLF
jgi:UDP-GlcNAc:undecaprenyl-phosphate GlcNAc-1-phosphate transferase